MLLRRFYDDNLAQASYLVGCQATGDALVLDPHRDVELYLDAAREEGLTIVAVSETHIHADYLSGSRELADRTGAILYLSSEGGEGWQYAFADADGAVMVSDGFGFTIGNLKIRVIHTPGHTPEHISFVLTDGAASTEPMGVFTGDFIFVGDVGRPDLLEKAAGIKGTMEAGARTLWGSIERFRSMPDYLQLWPGHGAGSACGKALGAVPQSTLGYEKMVNWAFACASEEEFVAEVLEGQPEPPLYFATMKRLNRDGPPLIDRTRTLQRVDPAGLDQLLQDGGIVVDVRSAEAFAEEHIPGTMWIPLGRSFTNWAGWLLPFERSLYLLADDAGTAAAAARDLRMIGLDEVEGFFDTAALREWSGTLPLESTKKVTPEELESWAKADGPFVVDVRASSEWSAGHLAGARHIHLGYLQNRLEEVPRDRPIVVQCRTGVRSMMGAGILMANGFKDVYNLEGGYVAWTGAGLPVEHQ